jgi:SpoVK/Ycf46/Vps4 family AAA+-type ATPase
MKFAHLLQTFLFIMCVNVHVVHTATQLSSAHQQPVQHEKLQKLLQQQIKVLRDLEGVIQLLVLTANSVEVANKNEFKRNAQTLCTVIQEATKNPLIDGNSTHFLGFLCKEITAHVDKALDTPGLTLPEITLATITGKYAQPQQLPLSKLEQHVQEGEKHVKNLSTKASQVGLAWYNKAYRVFDECIVQPMVTYNIPTTTAKALLTTLAGALWWWNFSSDNSWIQRKLGPPPQFNSVGGITNQSDLGRVGRWKAAIRNIFGWSPEVLIPAIPYIWKSEAESCATWVAKKADAAHNTFKGGTFAAQAQKDANPALITPRITLDNISGLEHAKKKLSFIVNYFENPEHYDRSGLTPPKGLLFTGAPRTGKTYIAEGLIGSIKARYKQLGNDPDDFKGLILTPNLITALGGFKSVYALAKSLAPCLMIIDEMDLLELQRSRNSVALSDFLNGMSGCFEGAPDKVVVVIGITNRPENLDDALRQPGRFSEEIAFDYPGLAERKQFLHTEVSKLATADSFDLDSLAHQTEGQSYEALKLIVKNAFQNKIVHGTPLDQRLLENSVDQEVHKIIAEGPLELSTQEQAVVAIHQAGQALTTMLLQQQRLAKVTIRPYLAEIKEESVMAHYSHTKEEQQQKKKKFGKIITHYAQDTKKITTHAQKLALCKIKLAGFIAEKIITGNCGYSYQPESAQQAFDIAQSLVTEGINAANLPPAILQSYTEKALALKKQCEEEVTELLQHHKDALACITKGLLIRHTLSGDEVHALATLPQTLAAQAVTQNQGESKLSTPK